MTLKKLSMALLLTVLPVASPALAQPAAPACADDPLFQQMDFTLGIWSVHDDKGGERARVRMEKVLGGCAISESWSSFDGSRVTGLGLFNYSRLLRGWSYAWVSANGTSTMFLGHHVEQNNIRYVTSRPAADGRVRVRHWSLIALPDGRIRELCVATEDGGATWITEYDLYWTRREQS